MLFDKANVPKVLIMSRLMELVGEYDDKEV